MIYKNVNGIQKLVTNIRKPKKWRRFEYLQSSGTQYIDTGINPKVKPRVVAVLTMLNNADKDYWGNKAINGSAYYANFAAYQLYYYRYGSTTSQRVNYVVAQNTIHEWDVSDKVYVDGVLKFTSANTYTYNASQGNIEIFKAGRSTTLGSTYRLHSFKLYDGDTLVRDFVPAQFNEEYGLWDLVQNRFYGNKGTGTFTVGPEIGKPYEEIEKLIVPSTLLPSGVELYDYIESSGTQWIDTGIYGTLNTKVILEFKIPEANSSTNAGKYFGCRDGQNNKAFIIGTGNGTNTTATYFFTQFDSVSASILSNFSLDFNKHIITLSKDGFYIDNTLYRTFNSSTTFQTSHTLPIFGYYSIDTNQHTVVAGILIVYSVKVFENNQLVRNMLPCTYFGEPGMWDTVTKQFYKNQGTGSFTLGNKIQLIQFEYLQTNANSQYIVTGISLTDGHWIAYDMIFRYEPNGIRRLMGTNGASSAYFGAHTNNTYSKNVQGSSQAIGNIDHMYDEINLYDSYKITCKVNNIQYHQTNINASNSEGPVNIFTLRTGNGGAGQQFYSGKIIYDGNIVRDFIPCTCNGIPGLWDKVELKFYGNSGSGTFALGRQVSGEIPVWVQKNALIKSSSNGVYDYIDTGINNYTMNNIRCVCEMTPLNGEDTAFFGSRGSYYLFYKVSDNYFWPTSKCETIQGRLAVGCKYLVDWNKGTLTVTGEDGVYQKGVRSSTTNNTQNLYIFTFNPKDARTAEAKIHWFKIYIDDVLVRDFVPATMGGRPGLYDKVNHKMYFNANSSGNFTVE